MELPGAYYSVYQRIDSSVHLRAIEYLSYLTEAIRAPSFYETVHVKADKHGLGLRIFVES